MPMRLVRRFLGLKTDDPAPAPVLLVPQRDPAHVTHKREKILLEKRLRHIEEDLRFLHAEVHLLHGWPPHNDTPPATSHHKERDP